MQRVQQPDYYALLGVEPTASPEELRAAHKRAMKAVHPDLNPDVDPTAAAQVNAAFEVLSDPAKRRAYDATRRSRRPTLSTRHDPQVRDARREAEQAAASRVRATRRPAPSAAEVAAAEAKREALRRDKEAAQQRLAAEKARLAATAAERNAKRREQREKKEVAQETSTARKAAIDARMRQPTRTPAQARQESDWQAFRAMVWKTLQSPVFLQDCGAPYREGPGRWEAHRDGILWIPQHGRPVMLKNLDIDATLQKLWQTGRVSQQAMIESLMRRTDDSTARRSGWSLFRLLQQAPFFDVRPDPSWALLFNRQIWETDRLR